METINQQVIVTLIGVIVTLGGVVGAVAAVMKSMLKQNGSNSRLNGNGVKNLDKEFTDQVHICNERFIGIAKETGEITSSLKSIDQKVTNVQMMLQPGRRRKII